MASAAHDILGRATMCPLLKQELVIFVYSLYIYVLYMAQIALGRKGP